MKKVYLQQICDKLNAMGFTEYNSEDLLSNDRKPFSVERGEVRSMHWLPEENLKKIAEFDISKCKDFRSVYQAWGREGLFKFVPYIIDEEDNPTLVLRHNKFLHMFRGYHFQVSETHDGIGSCHIGSYRTQGVIRMLAYNEDYADSHLMFLMMYGSMIDCGFQNDNFRYAFYEHPDVIDRFFKMSMEYWHIKFKYDMSLLKEYLQYEDTTLDDADIQQPVFELRGGGKSMCRFVLTTDMIRVEYNPVLTGYSSKVVTLNIPDVLVGVDTERQHWDEDDIEDLHISLEQSMGSYCTVERWLLVMVLKLVGINTNFMASYAIKKIGYLPDAKNREVIEFEDLNTFDK